jgi:glycopeptide antibiotics resistance protein
MFRKLLLLALTAGYAWVIWRMTLTPHLFSAGEQSFVNHLIAFASGHSATSWVTYDRAQVLANVAMFVPVGAIAAMWLPRRWFILAAVLAVGLSAGIEYVQGALLPYRVSDPNDVLANGAGGFLGALFIGVVRNLVPSRQRRPARRARTV